MGRLIDADALMETLERGNWVHITDYNIAIYAVKDAPAVEAVPVVRCRDCLYWQKSSLFRVHTVCRYVLDCSVVRREDDFCSRGERKDGEAHD